MGKGEEDKNYQYKEQEHYYRSYRHWKSTRWIFWAILYQQIQRLRWDEQTPGMIYDTRAHLRRKRVS